MLRQTVPYNLSATEADLYDQAVATYPQSGGIGTVSDMIYAGKYGMYIVHSRNAVTLVIVSLNSHPDGTTDLFIVMLSGQGSFTDFEYCLSDLKELAIQNGCKRVTGMISASVWEKFSQLGKLATDGYVMVSFEVDEESQRGQVESNGTIQNDARMRPSIHQDSGAVRDAEARVEQARPLSLRTGNEAPEG